MPRLPRLYMEGCAQHIIQRGNNRQACFFADEDYAFYFDRLKGASKKYQVSIHAFEESRDEWLRLSDELDSLN